MLKALEPDTRRAIPKIAQSACGRLTEASAKHMPPRDTMIVINVMRGFVSANMSLGAIDIWEED
jgi:hypothetical protein